MSSAHRFHLDLARPRRRGFAGFMAIFLLLLVASTLVVLGWAAVVEARRSRSQHDEAQLRQLLTAGAATAMKTLSAAGPPPSGQRQVALPAELTNVNASLTLTYSAPSADQADVEVLAALSRRRARQTLKFTRAAGASGWTIASATLAAPSTQPAFAPATQRTATTTTSPAAATVR